MQLENTNKIKKKIIHLKSKKQLKNCDRQIFSAFVHGFELPTHGQWPALGNNLNLSAASPESEYWSGVGT